MSDLSVQYLLQHHRELEKVLIELESQLEKLGESLGRGTAPAEETGRTVELLADHLDRLLRKKTEVLYPALEAYLPRDSGPLAVLRGEQAQLQSQFAHLWRTAKSLANGKDRPPLRMEFRRAGRATLQMLRDEIYKEDRVLFPMVSRLLPLALDSQLLEQMKAIDRNGGGAWSQK